MASARPRTLPLPHRLCATLERAFRADFSDVRLHEGLTAARLGVRAFACGNEIHFAPGCYRPDEAAGQWLLAHEFAHVVQQRTGRVANPFDRGVVLVDDPHLEAEADAWAALAMRGLRIPLDGTTLHLCRVGGRAVRLDRPEWSNGPPRVLQCDDEEDDGDLPKSKWTNVVSRHRTAKRVATVGMATAGVGMQIASAATGASAIAVIGAVAAGAAVTATGIGLVAAGGAMTVGGMIIGARAAYSTAQHLKRLEEIYAQRAGYCDKCSIVPGGGGEALNAEFANLHGWIADKVLPWIIRQKKHKLGKKVGAAVGAGLLVSLWSAGRMAYKKAKGTLGKRRTYFAECLAVHLITSNCGLAADIVTELYSLEEMRALKFMDSDQAAPLIADKMKSV